MTLLDDRINRYTFMSSKLACLSNAQLLTLLQRKTRRGASGIGGKSDLLHLEKVPLFVKRIPLTDLEHSGENFMSTANIFNLPMFYQYGVGSTGFGGWRELAAHVITTNWVLNQQCGYFPLLYHWRILPRTPENVDIRFWGNLDKYSLYWENSPAIKNRMEALNHASNCIVLFLEYIPYQLEGWLSKSIKKKEENLPSLITSIDQQLHATTHWMASHNFVHFDAHFKNILTDGTQIYFSDFGLALSSEFDLSPLERKFLNKHHAYDQAFTLLNLLYTIVTAHFGRKSWKTKLLDCLSGKGGVLEIYPIIEKYGNIAVVMDAFLEKLQKESKKAPYPAKDIHELLSKISRG